MVGAGSGGSHGQTAPATGPGAQLPAGQLSGLALEPQAPQTPVVDFSADQLDYDSNADIVTASGNVRMTREGNRVRADRVEWDRRTGRVIATGNVAATTAQGDTAYGEIGRAHVRTPVTNAPTVF